LKRRLIEVLVAGVRVDTFGENGVKQNKIRVMYRFSELDLPMPIVMAQARGTGSSAGGRTDRHVPKFKVSLT